MKLKRVWNVFSKEGMYTFLYLVKDNLKQKLSEEKKYQAYIKKCEPELNRQVLKTPLEEADENTMEVFCLESDHLLEQIQQSDCDYVGFVSKEDKLADFCKSHISCYLRYIRKKGVACSFLYTDEDELDETTGKRKNPKFKPEYSPDTILSYNYIGGFWCAKKELVIETLGMVKKGDNIRLFNEELMLRILLSIQPEQVQHLKGVYYHRRKVVNYSSQEFEQLAKIKEQILAEKGIVANIICEKDAIPVQHVFYECEEMPLVSIIIPSKDNPKLLKQCLDSIEKNTTYENYEIVVVDNGGSEEHRQKYQEILDAFPKSCMYHYEPMEFNFSKMCNIGAHLAGGEYYLFLNDDIEVRETKKAGYDWIRILLGQAMQPHTGAVGAKLLFPNTTLIQHIGIVNYESGAAHIYSKADDKDVLADYRNYADYNYLCVTGACLLVNAEKYHQVSGFSEELAVTFNDVELCMKLCNAGYYQVVRNDVVLYHHESITRGEDAQDEKKFRRHLQERAKLFQMQPQHVKRDCFYSPLLTQKRLDGGINTDFYSVLVKEPVLINESLLEGKINMTVRIEAFSIKDELTVRGYAYCNEKHNEKFVPCVVFKGYRTSYSVEAKQLYDPTMTKQEDSTYNLNFTQFISVADLDYMEDGLYEIYIGLKKNNRFIAMKNIGKVIEL